MLTDLLTNHIGGGLTHRGIDHDRIRMRLIDQVTDFMRAGAFSDQKPALAQLTPGVHEPHRVIVDQQHKRDRLRCNRTSSGR